MAEARPSRRWRLAALGVVTLLVALEAIGALALGLLRATASGPWSLAAQRDALAYPDEDRDDWFEHRLRVEDALHPYLGYVADPEENPGSKLPGYSASAAELGFARNRSALRAPREPDELVVAILGGSVAYLFADVGAPFLRAELEGRGRFAGKRLRIVSLAVPGYKQPQQLMAVAWMRALGAPLDVVINLDGFNEVALPVTEHLRDGVFPFYPRGWNVRVDRLGRSAQRALAERSQRERSRQARARAFARPPQRYSFVASAVWLALDRRDARALAASDEALRGAQSGSNASYQARGPVWNPANPADPYSDLVGVWERSSLALKALCEGEGSEYFHFLQPNQYVAGSKPLSDEERRTAWRAEQPYRVPVERGYPLLEAAGARLRERGVHFVSLSQAFSGVEETLYFDDCCHFNERGMERVAKLMAQTILATSPP